MKTPILDQYLFVEFERIKGLNVDSIDFNFESDQKIDKYIITDLFEGIDVILSESEKIERHFFYKTRKYSYCLTFNWNDTITGDEYALLLGKMNMLCGKLYLHLVTAGIRS